MLSLFLCLGLTSPSLAAETADLRFITEALYDEMGMPSEGLTMAKKDGLFAFLDESGKIAVNWFDPIKILEIIPDDTRSFMVIVNPFHEGYALIKVIDTRNGWYRNAFIDKQGKVKAEGVFTPPVLPSGSADAYAPRSVPISELHEGLTTVGGDAPGVIFCGSLADINGREVNPVIAGAEDYDFVSYTFFQEDMCVTYLDLANGYKVATYVKREGGRLPQTFEDARPFNDGLAFVKEGGKWGVIDKNGNYTAKPQFDDFRVFDSYTFQSFYQGLAWVVKNGKLGAVDKKGNTVIPFQYNTASPFLNDFAAVTLNGSSKKGYVNIKGEMIIAPQFDEANIFANGTALVGANGVYKLIDASGAQISAATWNFDLTRVYNDSPDTVFYQQNGKWGLAKIISDGDNPAKPATAEPALAKPTASSVLVNGTDKSFDAYNIEGSNYFKLRDLAYVLNGTEKQFEVSFDAAANAIALKSAKPYTIIGGEMGGKSTGNKKALPTSSKISLDGADISFTAYNIDGSNYFKLRDIGEALGFEVVFDSAKNAIVISTTS
jgi:hypothetical protein